MSEELETDLLTSVEEHLQAVADLRPGYSTAEKALEAMGCSLKPHPIPSARENAWSAEAAKIASAVKKGGSVDQIRERVGMPPLLCPTPTEERLAKLVSPLYDPPVKQVEDMSPPFEGPVVGFAPKDIPEREPTGVTRFYNGPQPGYTTKDSGERRVFSTGSQRDVREGKGRYDLLPASCIRRLAQLYERGAKKYGDRNWEKGQPLSSTTDSMIRHAFQYLAGDKEEDHLSAVVFNAFALMFTEEQIEAGKLPKELKDVGV